MNSDFYTIKNKRQDLSYAYTLNNVELPVLDVTHPLFISSIDEVKLRKMLLEAGKNAEKTAEKFNNMPAFIKNFLARRSFAMSELLQAKGDNTYLSGVSTLMLKLGPGLIGKGRKRFLDRLSSRGIGGIVLRMRVRDMSICQAKSIIPILMKFPDKKLCFINIAGGAASDSINALILILKENPALLQNRKIEINVMDIDTFGPGFAANCISVMKKPGGLFQGLDLTFRHLHYDWNDTGSLCKLLTERKDWLQMFSSEGGLFEYGSDEVVGNNLNAIFDGSSGEPVITGSLLHEIDKVDAAIIASLKISTGIKPRFMGLDGLKKICNNKWNVTDVIEGNPRYLVFCLKRAAMQ